MTESGGGIEVTGLQFGYDGRPPLFSQFSLEISPGSRSLLIGANGSGKTTLLRILAGKHMVGGRDVVRVLNCSAFHDTHLVCSGDLSYLGESWSKTIGSAVADIFTRASLCNSFKNPNPKGDVPLQGDFSAEHMIFGVEGADPVRREKLIDVLDIDLQWKMHKVSDGQRRRVQICMGLLHPYKVLLLDEVTVDLDVVTRMDLLDFFKEECEKRGATIVYATHIFDGLEAWATDLAYIQEGELKKLAKLSDIKELKDDSSLHSVVESWLRSETKPPKLASAQFSKPASSSSPFDGSPFISSRHMAYYR